jgi:hypothetical protein
MELVREETKLFTNKLSFYQTQVARQTLGRSVETNFTRCKTFFTPEMTNFLQFVEGNFTMRFPSFLP